MTEGGEPSTRRRLDVGSRADWLATGLSVRQFHSRVVSGELVRLRHGAYATGSVLARADDDPGLRHAVEVSAARARRSYEGVASHHSAALMRGLHLLREPPEGAVALTVGPGERGGGFRSASGVICHTAALPAAHLTTMYGVPMTTAARTVLDIARTSPFIEGVVAADSALYDGRTSKTELRRVLDYCARWPGVDRARHVAEFADPLSESVLESCARVIFAEHGLEPPELQVAVFNRDGRLIARADFCWPGRHTIAEADGMLKYTEEDDLTRKYKRDGRLLEAGWEVVHFSWGDLFRDPERVIAWIRAAFDRADRLRR